MKTTNKSSVTHITTPPSDILVVNAARVSFDKESSFDENGNLSNNDQRLLNYLAKHNHFTPFTHVRETFAFDENWLDIDWFVQSISQENWAGMVITKVNVNDKPHWLIRHSLYGWIQLLKLNKIEYLFQPIVEEYITNKLSALYKGSMTAFDIYSNSLNINDNSNNISDYVLYIDDLDKKIESDPINNPNIFDKHVIEFYQPEKIEYFKDITIRETTSIYTSRQRFKHMVGFTFNEVSKRYVDTQPPYFIPSQLRKRADDKKQGSMDISCDNEQEALLIYSNILQTIDDAYYKIVNKDGIYKVCPEQARGILPQSMITSYYATGNIKSWKRLITQRLDPHAQSEIRDLAFLLKEILENAN